MTTIVADHLMRKSTLRDINGNIINLMDEATGGYIIRNRQVVDPKRWEELQRIERDKQEAAKAITQQVVSPHAEARTAAPGQAPVPTPAPQNDKVDKLEKKVEGMEDKLDAILKKLG